MQDFEKKFYQLQELLEGRVMTDIPLYEYSTFRIGGPARMFFEARTNEDLVRAITYAKKLKIPFYIIGGGSNVLFPDEGLDFFVIHIATRDLFVKDEKYIVADAGVPLADVVALSIEQGLQGLVWASGIPGSLGGAVRGNAGAYGGEMAESVHSVEVMRGSKQFILERVSIDFGYRESQFKHSSDIILTVKLELRKGGDSDNMKEKSDAIIQERKQKHAEMPSAGSFFKNIPITYENEEIFKNMKDLPEKFWEYKKVPAGFLLDQLGLRGFSIGGAQVFEKHGNIIINAGGATADDVIQLASLMKMKVRDAYGIQLEEEVQIL